MKDGKAAGMIKFRRWLKASNPWTLPIFIFLAFFVIFPLVKLFVDSFTTADVPLSPLREAIMTVDLMDEKIASNDAVAAKAALEDLLVQVERSKAATRKTAEALKYSTFSQQESISKWNDAYDAIDGMGVKLATFGTPEEAVTDAHALKAILAETLLLPSKSFSVKFFFDVFKDKIYMKALINSLTLGVASVASASVIGFSVAYLLVRYEFPGRKLFNFLTMVPIVMPPLVGVLGFIFILGRGGTVNEYLYILAGKLETAWPALSAWLFDKLPFNFVYGWHGLLMVETLHLFPLITLNVVDSLSKIDASLEEAAESMGSVGLKRLFDITIPLTIPGFVTGALLVFIWAFADFATPHVVGLNNFIAPLAFMDIQQFIDRNLFKMGITVGAVMVLWSIVFLVIAKKYVSMKDYSTLSYRPVERRRLSKGWSAVALVFLIVLMLFAFIPYLGVGLASFARGWSMTPFPTTWTLHHYQRVVFDAPGYIINTFLYCTLAVILCILIGLPIAWIMARTKMRSRGLLDILTTLVLALPGTALGIAFIRAFNSPILIKQPLANIWIIIPIVLAVRRLPYTVRSSYSSLIVVHRSMEEAAESVGASMIRTFKDVTLPLIWKGVLAGALFSFMTSIQESAATILLSIPGWETMTVGIFNFYTGGTYGDAAALGFILIIVGIVTLYVVNRLSSTKAGGFFG